MFGQSAVKILYLMGDGEDQLDLDQLDHFIDFSHQIYTATTVAETKKALDEEGVDVVLLGHCLDDPEVYELMEGFAEVPFLILTGEGNEETAVRAFRAGALDYVITDEKDAYLSALPGVIERSIQEKEREMELKFLQEEFDKIFFRRTGARLVPDGQSLAETHPSLNLMNVLRQSEIRHMMIFNSAPDLMIVHNLEGNILDVNDKACEKLGYKRRDLLGISVHDILLEENREVYYQWVKKLRQGQRMRQSAAESTHQRKDGSTYPVELSGRVMDFKGEKVVVTAAREMTDQKRAKKAVRESEEMYRRLFHTSPVAMFVTTINGEWVKMNPAAVELFGYEGKEELETVRFQDLCDHPGHRKDHIEGMKDSGPIKDVPQTFLRKDGSEFPALITSVLCETESEGTGFYWIIRNLSDGENTEKEHLQISKQQDILNKLSRDLRFAHRPEGVYESILSHLRSVFDVDYFVLSAGGDKTDGEVRYVWGNGQDMDPDYYAQITSFAQDARTPLGKVFGEGKMVTIPDLKHHLGGEGSHYAFGKHGEIFSDTGKDDMRETTRSALLVPLEVAEGSMYVLEIQSYQRGAYGERDVSLMERIVNIIAMGLQKTYLLWESERHTKRMRTLKRTDQAIKERQSLPMMLDTLRDMLVSVLGIDAVDILYLHPKLKTLKIITQSGFRTNPMKYTDLELGEGPASATAASRCMVRIPDLREAGTEFVRSPNFDREEFATYIGIPLIVKSDLVGVLEIFHRSPLQVEGEGLDFLEMLAGQAAIAIAQWNLYQNLKHSKEQLNAAYDGIIESWAQALELRDIETKGHARRLVELTLQIARKLGVDEGRMADIRRGAYLHDVGKMGIPDRILKKKEKLTKEEREEISQHPLYAYEILKPIEYLRPALDIPLYHHERWDGLGYPEGLAGKETPLAARIFAVADVWDALRSGRPYRSAWSDEEALTHIKEESGKHFDPQVVEVFLELVNHDG
jgi:PAS domain S-box-containing protein